MRFDPSHKLDEAVENVHDYKTGVMLTWLLQDPEVMRAYPWK